MANNIFWGSIPPDSSGDWVDTGWGYWTNDKSLVSSIPVGWYDNGWGGISPKENAPDLEEDTVKKLETARDKAKDLGDTAVGRWIDRVLGYGKTILELGVGFGFIGVTEPLTYENLNKEKIRDADKKGQTGTYGTFTPAPNSAPTNSTYFGIDFSKPLNIVLVLLGLYAVYMIITKLSTPAVASPQLQPVPLKNQYRQQRPRQRYLQAA